MYSPFTLKTWRFIMGTKATWQVDFTDGTSIEVRATCKRMAKAVASVTARMAPEQISDFFCKEGKARNGNRPFNPNRNKKAWKREGYGTNPNQSDSYTGSGYTSGWW
jgi:hypothetical protein